MGIMVSEGRLDYDEKIGTYWPEFATNGKENIKVKHSMKHEGGLPTLKVPLKLEWLTTEGIK